jgi:PDZ domain-containing protein
VSQSTSDGGRGRYVPGAQALRSVSRRVRALIVAAVLFLILFVLALTLPVPYVVLSPGPTFNTLGVDNQGRKIIVIDGRKSNATTGHLNMTTVNVSTQPISAFAALSGWLLHDRVVVPKSSVYPPGQSEKQVNQQNSAEFAQSQDSAVEAAACELGYPEAFGILSITSGGAADGRLRVGDQLVSVDGKATGNYKQLAAVLRDEKPGTQVAVQIKRNGVARTVSVPLGDAPKGRSGASLGITVPVGTACLLPFHVDLGLGNEIGGPSAGMMFALGIMDKVGPNDLTGGKFIAGTGTIDAQGAVGPIGGIQLKMIAARKKGATIFLAPAGNCSDVRGNIPKGLTVVKVATLHQAVTDLLAIQSGKSVPHC